MEPSTSPALSDMAQRAMLALFLQNKIRDNPHTSDCQISPTIRRIYKIIPLSKFALPQNFKGMPRRVAEFVPRAQHAAEVRA